MTAEVPTFQTATADPLEALFAERDTVEAELLRYRKVDEARQAAERDLAAPDEEQAALDAAERADWSAWAPACDGPPPSPRTEAREALAQRRVTAAAALASALNGAKAVEPRRTELNTEFRRITHEIFKVRVDNLLAAARDAHETACEAAKTLLAAAQKSDGIRDALFTTRAEAKKSGNEARVSVTTIAIDAIEAMVRPDLVGDINERSRIAADVQRELDQ